MTARAPLLLLLLGLTATAPCAEGGREQKVAAEPNDKETSVFVLIRATAVCENQQIVLSDLAAISGPQALVAQLQKLPLGTAPNPGSESIISRLEIENALKKTSSKDITLLGATRTHVTAKGQRITADSLAKAAQEAVLERLQRYAHLHAEVEVVSKLKDLDIDVEEVRLYVDLSAWRPLSGTRSVRVQIMKGAQVIQLVSVSLKVTLTQAAAVSTQRIQNGEPITDGSYVVESTVVPNADTWNPVPVELLQGVRAKHTIGPGCVLEARMLERLPVIMKGDRVRVSIVRGTLTLTTSAEASEDAAPGQTVRLRLLDNGKEILAKAVCAGEATL